MSIVRENKVFVGLSGGVDSSVAAFLLKERGYDVTGVFIRSYNVDGCAERDAEDARRVAAHIGIPFYVFDFEEEYRKHVVEYMVQGYRNGLTPNPDVMCNKEIKFGLFLKKALEMGAPACRQAGIYVATGHYVRLALRHIPRGTGRLFAPAAKSDLDSRRVRSMGDQAERASETFRSKRAEVLAFYLREAKDKNKDQSYFLWTLTQEQLKHCLFPIGGYLKKEVREIARKAGLPTAEKKDSQGICFLGDVALDEFLKNYIKPKKGPIVDENGNKIGEHEGIFFYTIGQRHGLGLGGGEPYYIADKILKTNTIVVARGTNNPALYKREVKISNINFVCINMSKATPNTSVKAKTWASPRRQPEQEYWMSPNRLRVMARVRYRQPLVKATLVTGDRRQETSTKTMSHVPFVMSLKFDQPVKFVAPGQSVVFYEAGLFAGLRGRRMLGGGVII